MSVRSRAFRVLAGVCACAGCVSTSAPHAAPPAAVVSATRPDPLASAHALAPDYVARVYTARHAAAREPTPRDREEANKSVQLLEWAALAEADRITLTRQLTGYERRIERAELARAALERASRERERERVRDLAAAQERREAEWVFSLLQRSAGQALPSAERDRVWTFLVRRSQAVLAAARSLGADKRLVDDAELQLTAARTARLPDRVARARGALLRADTALGSARAHAPEASATERADLVQRLAERGFTTRAPELGPVAIDLLPTTARAPQAMRERFALLTELLPAFPHGAIMLGCGGPGALTGSTGCDSAQALMQSERARVQWQARPPELPTGAIRLILPGYAAAGIPPGGSPARSFE